MIALFDTNIYLAGLKGQLPETFFQEWKIKSIIRLSPVVHHELLRGIKREDFILEIKHRTIMLPSPSLMQWEQSAQIIKLLISKYGLSDGIYKLQNDVLIALAAKSAGAILLTMDKHFEKIAEFLAFHFMIVSSSQDEKVGR